MAPAPAAARPALYLAVRRSRLTLIPLHIHSQMQSDLKRKAAQLDAAENAAQLLRNEVASLKAAHAELLQVGIGGGDVACRGMAARAGQCYWLLCCNRS